MQVPLLPRRVLPVLAGVLRTLVGVFLVLAALLKATSAADASSLEITGVAGFARAIADQGIIPAQWSYAAAFGAIVAEIVLGALLLIQIRPRVGAALACGLLVALSAYLLLAYARNPRMPCGCLGRLTSGTVRDALIRNLLLIIALGASFVPAQRARPSPRASIPRTGSAT